MAKQVWREGEGEREREREREREKGGGGGGMKMSVCVHAFWQEYIHVYIWCECVHLNCVAADTYVHVCTCL